MLDHRAERERREESEPADDQDHADEQADEQAAIGREGADDAGTVFLAASEPAIAIAGMITKKRPTSIAMPPVRL